LEEVEELAHRRQVFQLLAADLDAQKALGVDDEGDHVHRIDAEAFAQVHVVVQPLEFAGRVVFQLFSQNPPQFVAFHPTPP
jgi:hypothetical protein